MAKQPSTATAPLSFLFSRCRVMSCKVDFLRTILSALKILHFFVCYCPSSLGAKYEFDLSNCSIIFMFTKVDHLTNFNQRLIPDWTCSSQRVWETKSTHQTYLGLSSCTIQGRKMKSFVHWNSIAAFILPGRGRNGTFC